MFTYGPDSTPATYGSPIDNVRLLIADTVEFAADGTTPAFFFSDEEILGAYQIQASLVPGRNLPISPLRVAALLLDSLASNRSRLTGGNVIQLLDVKLSAGEKASSLREMAQAFRDADDNAGAIVVIQQITNDFSFRDYMRNAAQRGFFGGPA